MMRLSSIAALRKLAWMSPESWLKAALTTASLCGAKVVMMVDIPPATMAALTLFWLVPDAAVANRSGLIRVSDTALPPYVTDGSSEAAVEVALEKVPVMPPAACRMV